MSERRFHTPVALLLLLSVGACTRQGERPRIQPVQPADRAYDRPLTLSRNPEYREATKLFSRKQYARAEKAIQALLSRRTLSETDRTFLTRQRDICRQARMGRKVAQAPEPARKGRGPEDADCGPRALSAALQTLGVRKDALSLRPSARTTGYANYTTQGGSERRGTVSKFYHYDALGSTRGITDSSQTATDSILYDGFGMTVSRTGTTPTPFGFGANSQYQTDYDSGLMLLGHRYYDASIGRFITRDPAKDGRNWYAYCENNPLNRVDPTGLRSIWDWIDGIASVSESVIAGAIALGRPLVSEVVEALGHINNSPNTLIGGLISVGGEHSYDPVHQVILVEDHWLPNVTGHAITIGQVIYWPGNFDPDDPNHQATYGHELVHVMQGQTLGILYLPTHGLSYGYGIIPGLYNTIKGDGGLIENIHNSSPLEMFPSQPVRPVLY